MRSYKTRLAHISFAHISVNTSSPQGRRRGHSGPIAIAIAVSWVITVTVTVACCCSITRICSYGWYIARGHIANGGGCGGHVEAMVIVCDHLMTARRDDGRKTDSNSITRCDGGGGDAMRCGSWCWRATNAMQKNAAAEQKNNLAGGRESKRVEMKSENCVNQLIFES